MNEEKNMICKAFLKEKFSGQHRIYNRNLERIRKWFENGVGMFSKDDFASTNLRNDMRMKNEFYCYACDDWL